MLPSQEGLVAMMSLAAPQHALMEVAAAGAGRHPAEHVQQQSRCRMQMQHRTDMREQPDSSGSSSHGCRRLLHTIRKSAAAERLCTALVRTALRARTAVQLYRIG
jgi:hypothetical protein